MDGAHIGGRLSPVRPRPAGGGRRWLRRPGSRVIFDRLARSPDPTDRYKVAVALLDLASVDASAVARDLTTRLARDSDELVAKKAHEDLEAIAHLDENAYIKRFRPFGI